MALEHVNSFDSHHHKETQEHVSAIYSSTLGMPGKTNSESELASGKVPHASIGKNGDLFFGPRAAKDVAEKVEQPLDRKIKDSFGADVFVHLKDQDWLIENRQKLEVGFLKANDKDAWDMAKRMQELSIVDGNPLIYTSKVESPTHGNLIPKRHDVYLRRGMFRSDDYIGQFYH